MLVEWRGPEAVRALLPTLSTATSMEDWLKKSLDMNLSEIQIQWASATMVEIIKAR